MKGEAILHADKIFPVVTLGKEEDGLPSNICDQPSTNDKHRFLDYYKLLELILSRKHSTLVLPS